MKKQYEKPVIIFEDFTDYESIYDPKDNDQMTVYSLSLHEIIHLLTK